MSLGKEECSLAAGMSYILAFCRSSRVEWYSLGQLTGMRNQDYCSRKDCYSPAAVGIHKVTE